MTKQPLITVVTVVYNIIKDGRKDFLLQNFESVHNQTYQNIEHLVIDGKSTDGTLDILKEYSDKKWIRYISEQDNGPYDAMNNGIKNANGDFIVFLHSDDYFYDNTVIELQMEALIRTNSDYTIGDTVFIKNSSELFPLHYPNNYDDEFFFQKGDNVHTFWQDIPFNHEGIIVKKDVFKKIGLFDEQKIYGVAVDYKFEIDLILNDMKYVYIPYNIIYFRCDGMSSNLCHDDCVKFCNILRYLYSKFYSENVLDILAFDKIRAAPNDLFLFELKTFLEELHLKNFNYTRFNSFLEKIRRSRYKKEKCIYKKEKCIIMKYLFLGLPLMKIKTDVKGNKHFKLFFLFPILKIKHDSKGGKTYKLFSFLPVLKIRKK